MNENGIVPNINKNTLRCRCPQCPVYNECMKTHKELLFCSTGISGCEIQKKGCLCLHCPIEIEYRLNSFFYCQKGEATEKNVASEILK